MLCAIVSRLPTADYLFYGHLSGDLFNGSILLMTAKIRLPGVCKPSALDATVLLTGNLLCPSESIVIPFDIKDGVIRTLRVYEAEDRAAFM